MKLNLPILLVLTLVALVIGVNATLNHAQQNEPQDDNGIVFQWAFGAIKQTDLGPQFEIIQRDSVLKSGDQIKFFLGLNDPSYLYLIYQSSQQDLIVLFPQRFKDLGHDKQIAGNHYIPKGDQWFELDEYAGLEKFYLLASVERLTELENMVNAYESADKANRGKLGKKVVSEIRRLRKKHRKFKTYAEKPVAVIGNMRGSAKTKAVGLRDLADHAVEISTTNFFSRTYTIDHQ
ncbi:MAG: DUF4384 domain-containing protein [Deltaproteobacteria bacterium]|jgi:hypothetical protein|nr:DUF4384 domain-containing protein [Deltaproteobacteria bacterium]